MHFDRRQYSESVLSPIPKYPDGREALEGGVTPVHTSSPQSRELFVQRLSSEIHHTRPKFAEKSDLSEK